MRGIVSDDERRAVAEDMRKMAFQRYPLTIPVLSCFIRAEKSDPASLWNRLADLIDPADGSDPGPRDLASAWGWTNESS